MSSQDVGGAKMSSSEVCDADENPHRSGSASDDIYISCNDIYITNTDSNCPDPVSDGELMSAASINSDSLEDQLLAEEGAALTAFGPAERSRLLSDLIGKRWTSCINLDEYRAVPYYSRTGQKNRQARSNGKSGARSSSKCSAALEAAIADMSGSRKQPLCWFHITGVCKFNNRCLMRHGEKCKHCGLNCLDPADKSLSSAHLNACKNEMDTLKSPPGGDNCECPICLEPIKEAGKMYGIIECNHCICFDCINTWKAQAAKIGAAELCPVCRKKTSFFFPSTVWPTTAFMKKTLVKSYISHLRKVPCKFERKKRESCPYGEACFFSHSRPNGT